MKTLYTYISAILFLLFGSCIYAQDFSKLSNDKNYILKIVPSKGSQTINMNQEVVSVQYFDGLGRLEQTVVHNTASDKKITLVSNTEYYDLNNVSKQWLPTPFIGVDSARYRGNTIVEGAAKSSYIDQKPYSLTVYDGSPLNRVVRQYGAGEIWHNNEKYVGSDWYSNTATGLLSCRYYYVLEAGDLAKSSTYASNELYVTKMKDEDGGRVYEFKDKSGKVILKRRVETAPTEEKYYDTYYVYDKKERLIYVLPPSGTDLLSQDMTWSWDNEVIKQYCYAYKYDGRNRMIEKQLPGCSSVKYIYDINDRVLFTQDGVQRSENANKWSFMLYDRLGRPTINGVAIIPTAMGYSDQNIYCEFNQSINAFGTGYNILGITLTNPTILSINYYDNYDYKTTLLGFDNSYNYQPNALVEDTRYNKTLDNIRSRGLLTGSIVYNLDNTAQKQKTVLYYDDKDRVVFSCSNNHLGGYDRVHTAYTFTGLPDLIVNRHTTASGSDVTEQYDNNYDHAGKLLSTDYTINVNGNPVTQRIVDNKYDDLGRLKNATRNAKESLKTSYEYNIRSWTTKIASTGFTQDLVYFKNENNILTGSFSGNIHSTKWKHTPTGALQEYTYQYDSLSRLTSAVYNRVGSTDSFNESLSYDKNGNILSLNRTSGNAVIDDLAYEYSGNMIRKITDNAPTASKQGGYNDKSNVAREYFYDNNGSMTKDLDRELIVKYNLLNLPKRVTTSGSDSLLNYKTYNYDATGQKLQVKSFANGNVTLTEDYIGNKIYENSSLSKVLIPGGYVSIVGRVPTIHYYQTDHLGNIRQVLSSDGVLQEQNDYYAFGMRQQRGDYPLLASNKYKYNGKELETFNNFETLDYGARYYDPTIGRWHSLDPRAEEVNNISPYNYVANNPIIANDPDGEFLNVVIGAVVGAVAEMTSQIVSTMVQGGTFKDAIKNMDWADVGVSTAQGALIGSGVGTGAALTIGAGGAVVRSGVDITAEKGVEFAGIDKPMIEAGKDLLGEAVGMATGNLLPLGKMAGNAVSDAFVKNGIKSGGNFFAGMVVSDLTSGIVDGVTSGLVNGAYSRAFDAIVPEGLRIRPVRIPAVTVTYDRKTKALLPGETKKVQEHIKNHGYKSWLEKTQK